MQMKLKRKKRQGRGESYLEQWRRWRQRTRQGWWCRRRLFSFLLSCLLCFSSQPPSPLPFFRYLLFFSSVPSWLSVVVGDGTVSGGQVVCCGGGEEAQWQLRLLFFSGIYFFSVTPLSLLCLL